MFLEIVCYFFLWVIFPLHQTHNLEELTLNLYTKTLSPLKLRGKYISKRNSHICFLADFISHFLSMQAHATYEHSLRLNQTTAYGYVNVWLYTQLVECESRTINRNMLTNDKFHLHWKEKNTICKPALIVARLTI